MERERRTELIPRSFWVSRGQVEDMQYISQKTNVSQQKHVREALDRYISSFIKKHGPLGS